MTSGQWNVFSAFKNDLLQKIDEWHNVLEKENLLDELKELQRLSAEKDGVPPYELSDPFVYNKAFDDITKDDDISLIVIGDNPGKNEQLKENRRYLVGQSGKIAENFFARNGELGVVFRKNVIILNKSPLHSAKTKELSFITKNGNPLFAQLLLESQLWCAKSTSELHTKLHEEAKKSGKSVELWLVGYAELKGKGLFIPYRDELIKAYGKNEAWNKVFVYQHFSMNRFLIDLGQNTNSDISLKDNLITLGERHRKEIFEM